MRVSQSEHTLNMFAHRVSPMPDRTDLVDDIVNSMFEGELNEEKLVSQIGQVWI